MVQLIRPHLGVGPGVIAEVPGRCNVNVELRIAENLAPTRHALIGNTDIPVILAGFHDAARHLVPRVDTTAEIAPVKGITDVRRAVQIVLVGQPDIKFPAFVAEAGHINAVHVVVEHAFHRNRE